MKKLLLIAGAAVLLAGCQPKVYTKFVYVQAHVPEQYLVCKQLEKADYPDPEKLTDDQAAQLLALSVKRLETCGSNMNSTKKFIDRTNALAAEKNKRPPVLQR
ncbi:hypothetical protein AU106_gp036 [Sinorhizobium phage phiM9]|uniref:Lipoprotein n=1 Tax=Sinorhizobium phage phiM9 TaxID=1636182 RepID=A0A0F6R4V6_9CAUD|nr:hypothetical protein AU106_gp036 [Sinorhizobium phage phiM9]AKE44667.1 hypothetical protein Sm_phiM9_037 [Sinorhizobium phage phiM9]